MTVLNEFGNVRKVSRQYSGYVEPRDTSAVRTVVGLLDLPWL